MHAARGDADLGAEAELAAIRELRRGIVQHDRAVDLRQKARRRRRVGGDDRIRVVRTVALDMRDGLVQPCHHLRGDDAVEEFRAPVRLACGRDARVDRLHRPVAAHRAAGVEQRLHQRCEMGRRHGSIDEQRLRRAANAGAPELRVEQHLPRHRKIGFGVDINVVVAIEMRENRHPRLGLHALDKALAAARNDDVDRAIKAREHLPDRLAIPDRHELDRRLWHALSNKPGHHRGMDGDRRAQRARAGAQDDRVARLEAERASIRRHVRAALEDDADDAERRAHAGDFQPVRPCPFAGDRADGVWQRSNILDRRRDGFDARRGQ